MKSIVKKSRLLLLSLVGFLIIGVVSIAVGITIIKTTPDDSEHRVTLHSLYLEGGVTNEALMGASEDEDNLNIKNGLIIGTGDSGGDGQLSSIGGGLDNKIQNSSNEGGIGGGRSNEIAGGNNSAIGGGYGNKTQDNNTVVVGGYSNSGFDGGVVLGGRKNSATGVVLGGSGNKAMRNSLVLGQNASGSANSFAWNSVAQPNEARVNAKSGVLIGTYNPIDGVSLVVSGAVKLGDGSAVTGAIRLNSSGCLTMYDGHTHVLGKKSKSRCGVASGCEFGSVFLQDGDVVTGYSVSYSTNCNDKLISVQCNNGDLSQQVYPYCYKMDDSPIGNGGGGNGGGGNGGGGNGGFDKCDVNHDGVIDASDMNLMLNCYANGDSNGGWCDINGDGNVDVADWNYFVSGNECNNKIMG